MGVTNHLLTRVILQVGVFLFQMVFVQYPGVATFPATVAIWRFSSESPSPKNGDMEAKFCTKLPGKLDTLGNHRWIVPPPSNSGKWRFIGIPY